MKSITKKITLGAVVIVAFIGYAYETYLKPSTTTPITSVTPTGTVATPTGTTGSTGATGSTSGTYKDGTYTGSVADAYFGSVQVAVNITAGKISNVTFLQYPNDRGTSKQINAGAMPRLSAEAVAAQSANVNIVSGATQTSQAFEQSLQAALSQAAA